MNTEEALALARDSLINEVQRYTDDPNNVGYGAMLAWAHTVQALMGIMYQETELDPF